MASVSCKCGEVKISFPVSDKPRVHSICCCDDCQKRVSHLATLGGKPLGDIFALGTGVEVVNFEGQLKVDRGLNLLYFYRLRTDTNMVNVGCKCCHSYMIARNTDFHGNSVATLPQFANVEGDLAGKPIQFVSFRQFWPVEMKLPEGVPEFWKAEDGKNFDGSPGFEKAMKEAFGANLLPFSKKIEGTITFDELIQGVTIVTV